MPAVDQGIQPGRYQVIPRVLIFLTCENRVLLIRGAANKRIWPNLYNGLGGHIEQGEDIFQAAQRELEEESGYRAANLYLAGVITIDPGVNPGVLVFVFRGEMEVKDVRDPFKSAPSHEGDLEWVPIQQVADLPLVEDLYTLLPFLLNRRLDSPPFTAQYSYDAQDHLLVAIG